MKTICVLISVLFLTAACSENKSFISEESVNFSPKIFNGEDSKTSLNKWQVSFQAFGHHFCGGSVIAPNAILTAAHCVKGQPMFKIFGGGLIGNGSKSDLMELPAIKTAYIHPLYEQSDFGDMAVLILEENIDFQANPNISVIEFATKEDGPEEISVLDNGGSLYATGWGQTEFSQSPSQLQKAEFEYLTKENLLETINLLGVFDSSISEEEKSEQENLMANYFMETISASLLIGVMDNDPNVEMNVCFGDSGGPLVREYEDGSVILMGVASFILGECGHVGFYSNVKSYADWIYAVLEEASKENNQAKDLMI